MKYQVYRAALEHVRASAQPGAGVVVISQAAFAAVRAALDSPQEHVVAVSGGRNYGNGSNVFITLNGLHARHPIDLLIQGQCKSKTGGADELARRWAVEREVNCLSVPAKWGTLGIKAGYTRNREMGTWGPDEWVLFPGGPGTASAKEEAIAIYAKTLEVSDDGSITEGP